MRTFIIRRLFFSVFTLIGATLIVFTLSRLAGDPRYLYVTDGGYGLTDEMWENIGKRLNLDKPVIVQYFIWLGQVVRGDLGDSLLGRMPVFGLIKTMAPATLQLGAVSWVLATCIGVPLGIMSAVKRGAVIDYLGRGFALLGQAIPVFWIGIMAILFFAVKLDWLPAGGKGDDTLFTSMETFSWDKTWKYFVLPAGTLGLAASAGYLRLTRSAMLEILDSEYIKLARAKGVGTNMIIWKHAFKNALIPPLTMSALILIGFITGTIVVETVFTWPGLGRLAVISISENDYPVMIGVALTLSLVYVTVNFFVDIAYAFIDPRIRYT
jgi:peptide/nickel transport system permease protein